MKRSALLVLVVCTVAGLALSGCAKQDDSGHVESAQQQTAMVEAPTQEDAAAATYTGIYENPVTLSDGRYEGEPVAAGGASRPSVTLVDGMFETGDLDGDGSPEAAALLVENSGGTGSNVYLVVLARRDGAVANVGTSLVGDRVQVRKLSVHDRQVFLDVVQHGADDAMCCPTETAERTWSLADTGLEAASTTVTGTISVNDLMDTQWVLTHLSRNEPAPDSVTVTLHFTEGRVWGNGGCNNYFAELTETSPANISLSKIGSTRMACPDNETQLETRFLKTLQGANKYSFVAGKLALTCKVGDGVTTMLFEGDVH